MEKDFSHEQLKRNENDLLIIQEYSSKNNDEKIIEFIKSGGKIVLFPESENKDQEYKFQNWGKIESASKNNFLKFRNGIEMKVFSQTLQMEENSHCLILKS